jgi:hypothetical protein
VRFGFRRRQVQLALIGLCPINVYTCFGKDCRYCPSGSSDAQRAAQLTDCPAHSIYRLNIEPACENIRLCLFTPDRAGNHV